MSRIVTVTVGLDYHEASVRVCVMDDEGLELANRNLPNDVEAVYEFVIALGQPRKLVIEACGGAAEFASQLIRISGWNVKVAHPGYVHRLKQGPDKTDNGDAWLLADLARVNYVPEVWLADEYTRQLRRLVSYRDGLAAEKKNVKLRIRALLREERAPKPFANPWTKDWMEWLKTVRLGVHSRWVIDQEIEQLARLEASLEAVEKRMQDATAQDADTQKLLQLPAIGTVTAVTLRAEIGRFDRFGNGKQLSRFCGVTPCNASSGKRQADAGLIRAGSPQLRALLMQLAQRLPRLDEHWKQMKQRLCMTKPTNVAIAAIANHWVRKLYHHMVAEPAKDGSKSTQPAEQASAECAA